MQMQMQIVVTPYEDGKALFPHEGKIFNVDGDAKKINAGVGLLIEKVGKLGAAGMAGRSSLVAIRCGGAVVYEAWRSPDEKKRASPLDEAQREQALALRP